MLQRGDAEELHSLIEQNRLRLARWLVWPATQTFEDTLAFVIQAEREAIENAGFHAAVVYDRCIVGVASHMAVDWRHRRTLLGYWLDAEHQGKGLMTAAVRALVGQAFSAWGLNRVEIRVAAGNRRSQGIPERLAFSREATLRQAEYVNGSFVDTVLYGMLAADWREPQLEVPIKK